MMICSRKLGENDLASLLFFETNLLDLKYGRISATVPIVLTGHDGQSSDSMIFRSDAVDGLE